VRVAVSACVALLVCACNDVTSPKSASPSATAATPTPISAAGAQKIPLAQRIRTVTQAGRVGIPIVAFGSVWAKTGPGDVVRIDETTGKLEQTYPTDRPAPVPGCEGMGATENALWVCRRPGTYIRLTPQGRISHQVSFDGYHDQLRIPAMAGRLWLLGEDRTALHTLDAATGKEVGAPIEMPVPGCDNVAVGLDAVWVACHLLGLVKVDPVSRSISGTVSWPGGSYVAVDTHLLIGGYRGVAEVDPHSLTVRSAFDLRPDYKGDLTTSGNQAWVATSGATPLTQLDLNGQTVAAVLTTPDPFDFVGVTLAHGTLWVSDSNDRANRHRMLSVSTTATSTSP